MTGSAGEAPIIDAVRQCMTHLVVSLAGQTTLRSLGALLQVLAEATDLLTAGPIIGLTR